MAVEWSLAIPPIPLFWPPLGGPGRMVVVGVVLMGGACSCWTRLEEEERAARGGAVDGPDGEVVVPKQLSLKDSTY